MTSPPQRAADTAAPRSSANHNGDPAENSRSEHDSGQGGGAFERLEIIVKGEERNHDSALPVWLMEGASVSVGSSKAGTVRYVGATQFAEGVWVGVELDTPVGRCQTNLRLKSS